MQTPVIMSAPVNIPALRELFDKIKETVNEEVDRHLENLKMAEDSKKSTEELYNLFVAWGGSDAGGSDAVYEDFKAKLEGELVESTLRVTRHKEVLMAILVKLKKTLKISKKISKHVQEKPRSRKKLGLKQRPVAVAPAKIIWVQCDKCDKWRSVGLQPKEGIFWECSFKPGFTCATALEPGADV